MTPDRLARWLRTLGLVELHRRLVFHQSLITVLCLHRVSPVADPFYPRLHPGLLADLCRYVKDEYRVVLFRDLTDHAAERSSLPLLILSFDDAYMDFFDYAMPTLLKHGLRANLNVVTACADTGEPYTWQACLDHLACSPRGGLKHALGDLGIHEIDVDGAPEAVGLSFTRWFQRQSEAAVRDLERRLAMLREGTPHRPTPMMRWGEIREAERMGFEIGAHSVSHASLDTLPQAALDFELRASKARIEGKLGRAVDIFAFPGGRHSSIVLERARSAGYRHLLLVGDRLNRPSEDAWSRVLVYGQSLDRLVVKAAGLEAALRRRAWVRAGARLAGLKLEADSAATT